MLLRSLWSTLLLTFSKWNAHEAPRLGAALAFYTMLSLAPLIIFVIAVVALVFGHSGAQEQIVNEVQSMAGQEGATVVRAMVEHSQKPAAGILGSLVGLITLLFGASGVFGELRSALNKIWEVQANSDGGIWGVIKQRLFSFGMVLAIGFLLLVSLVISAALAMVGKFLGGLLPLPEIVLTGINFAISWLAIAALFGLIFKYVPETKIAWRDVWVGAMITSLLFAIGKFLIGLYLGKASVGSAYGAAGSLTVVIVWVYYSSLIFFFGAEFTHLLPSSQLSPTKKV